MFYKDFMINWAVASVSCALFGQLFKIPLSVEGFCVQVAIGVVAIVLFRGTLGLFKREK